MSASFPASPKLIITLSNGKSMDRELQAADVRIGRGPSNDIVLDDSFASTNHAVFHREAAGWVVQDLGSANGTRVNNQRITGQHVLQNGDVVQVGHCKFIYSQPSPPVAAPPPVGWPAAAQGPVSPAAATVAVASFSGSAPFLHVVTSAGKEFDVKLSSTSVKVGRAPQNDIVLDDGFASTYHAEVRQSPGGGYCVTDMGSSNGTKVNDQKIVGTRVLQGGDVIQIGRAQIVFSALRAEAAAQGRPAAPPAPYPLPQPQPAIPHLAPPPVAPLQSTVAVPAAPPVGPPAYASGSPFPPTPPLSPSLAEPPTLLESKPKMSAPPPGKAPILVVVMPTGEHVEYPMAQFPVGIGKAVHNQVVINHPTVSQSHAEVRVTAVGYEVVDLGSRNGTFVNDQPVTEKARPLTHGDKIRVGQVLMTFRNPQEKTREATVAVDLDQLRSFMVAGPVDGAAAAVSGGEEKPKKKDKEKEKGEDEDKKKKKKKKAGESRMASTLVNALSRIVAPLIAMVVTIYFLAPRSGPTTNQTTQTNAIKSLAGNNCKSISGAVFIPGAKTILYIDDEKPKEIFSFSIDTTGNQGGNVTPIPLGVEINSAKGITYDPTRKFLYVIGSQASTNTGALLRVRFDPVKKAFAGPPEVIADFRSFLLNMVPELQKVGINYSESVAGIAWDEFNNHLLVAMPSPTGDETLVVPVRMKDDTAPFTPAVLEITNGKAMSILKGQTVTEIQYDVVGKSVVLVTTPKTVGTITAFCWDGRDGSKPADLSIQTPNPVEPRGFVHAMVDTSQFWFLLAANGSYTSTPAAAVPAATP